MAEHDRTKRTQSHPDWRTSTTERLRSYPRGMRSNPTEAERRLWSLVRDRRLAPHKFRRQVPIGRFIVDLVCLDRKLIVETDDSQHAKAGMTPRDRWLAEQGFRILRIWNNDMLARPGAVLTTIAAHLEEQEP